MIYHIIDQANLTFGFQMGYKKHLFAVELNFILHVFYLLGPVPRQCKTPLGPAATISIKH